MEIIKLKLIGILTRIESAIWRTMPPTRTQFDICRDDKKQFYLEIESDFLGVKGFIVRHLPITRQSMEGLQQAANIAISRMEFFDNTNTSVLKAEMTKELQDKVAEIGRLFIKKEINALEGNNRLKVLQDEYNSKGLSVEFGAGFVDE